jgi:hypothetical protein
MEKMAVTRKPLLLWSLLFLAGCGTKPSTPADASSEEPVYQGKTLTYWLKQMEDRDEKTRENAAATLVSTVGPNDKKAVAVLIKGLKDHSVFVRERSAEALGKIGGPAANEAVPALTEALNNNNPVFDPDSEVSFQAAVALGNIGPPAASPAVPTLVNRWRTGKKLEAVIKALRKIDPKIGEDEWQRFYNGGPKDK